MLAAMKKIFLLCACLLAFVIPPLAAQTSGPGVAVVSFTRMNASYKAVISREDGRSELLEIPLGASDKKCTETSQGYQKLISKLYHEGYALKSTFGGEGRINLIFVKGP